jgi:type II secretory pathway pseudopilin PulG
MNKFLHNHLRLSCSRGFTFVELLAAMLFMAIVIPVTIQGITIANRAGVMAERSRVAAQLADNKLTEVILTESWRDEEQDGDFGEDWLDGDQPRYQWSLTTEAWEEDTMRVVTVKVVYKVQENEYEVSLSTIVDEEEDEDTEE